MCTDHRIFMLLKSKYIIHSQNSMTWNCYPNLIVLNTIHLITSTDQ